MLPAEHRLRRSTDFQRVTRSGSRASCGSVVVHLLIGTGQAEVGRAPQVGFTVGKGVGGSVVRHRVARRLRASLGPILQTLPGGTLMVVRAQPSAGTAASSALRRDVEIALRAALKKSPRRSR